MMPGIRGTVRIHYSAVLALIPLQVLERNIVNRNLFRGYLSHIRVGCIFYASDCLCLKGLPFCKKLFDTLRIRLFKI